MARLIRSLLMLGMVYVLATASFCELCEFDSRFCDDGETPGGEESAVSASDDQGTAGGEKGAIR